MDVDQPVAAGERHPRIDVGYNQSAARHDGLNRRRQEVDLDAQRYESVPGWRGLDEDGVRRT